MIRKQIVIDIKVEVIRLRTENCIIYSSQMQKFFRYTIIIIFIYNIHNKVVDQITRKDNFFKYIYIYIYIYR